MPCPEFPCPFHRTARSPAPYPMHPRGFSGPVYAVRRLRQPDALFAPGSGPQQKYCRSKYGADPPTALPYAAHGSSGWTGSGSVHPWIPDHKVSFCDLTSSAFSGRSVPAVQAPVPYPFDRHALGGGLAGAVRAFQRILPRFPPQGNCVRGIAPAGGYNPHPFRTAQTMER